MTKLQYVGKDEQLALKAFNLLNQDSHYREFRQCTFYTVVESKSLAAGHYVRLEGRKSLVLEAVEFLRGARAMFYDEALGRSVAV